MMRRQIHNQAGDRAFSLVETMFGVLILGTIVASCLMALRLVYAQTETARNNALASQVMQTTIESMRTMNWEQISALSDGAFPLNQEFRGTAAERFERRMEVRDLKPALRELSLEVEWTGFNGTTSTRRFTTYFAHKEISGYDDRSFQ